MAMIQCVHFNGYKPCGYSDKCDPQCSSFKTTQHRILIIHLGAIGAVVRGTSLLSAIERKYPQAHITWVTEAPSDQLLKNHPRIHRVLTTTTGDLLVLSTLIFDVAFVVDKSLKAVGVLKQTYAQQVFGFNVHPDNGAIVPATAAAEELWSLGLDNYKKFFVNTKPETQLMVEAFELGPFRRDSYQLHLSFEEKLKISKRQYEWSHKGDKIILGFNTGCSEVIAAKKWTVEYHREIIKNYLLDERFQIVLLGGPEDTFRNQQIAAEFGAQVICSDTQAGLREGLISVAACDIIVTGDSLGMHMAIAMEKFVVAWFGPTCAHEIDLYDRGVKLLASVACAPCWKRSCQKEKMCYDQVSPIEVIKAIEKGYEFCLQDQSQHSFANLLDQNL